MKDTELQNFKNFVELKLRECFDQYERDFIKWSADSFADLIAREIHQNYQVKQKWDSQKWVLVPENEVHPYCHGCGNELGTCGTPCTACSTSDRIEREWKVIFWIPDKFRIYERITV